MEDSMKKRSFLKEMLFVFFTMMAVLGCKNPANPVYDLSPPVINGSCTADYNDIYWEPVAGADYYKIYGLQFTYNTKDRDGSIPKDPKKYKEVGSTRELSYRHQTPYDWVYAVRAFSDDGKQSDFSKADTFTPYWPE